MRFCPLLAGGACLRGNCAWFWECPDGPKADPWGECAVLLIATDLHDIVAHDANDLGMVHIRVHLTSVRTTIRQAVILQTSAICRMLR